MQIGVGLQLYHQANRHYPTVPDLGGPAGDAPIRAMLDSLSLPDLIGLRDPSTLPRPGQAPPSGSRVAGLVCPSDPYASSQTLDPRISYRAVAGDTPAGVGGPFQPGRLLTSAEVEAADGLGFTAGFAERMVGGGIDGRPGPMDYATTPGPVGEVGCPQSPVGRWKGDAGSSWSEVGWRSTLYNHAIRPGGSPSCIADDGRTAMMGASSAHPNRINVLLLDGSLRGVTPSMDLNLWRALGTVRGRSESTPGR